MKKVLQVIGAITVLGFTSNVLGLIDFKLCVAQQGGCEFISKPPRPVFTNQIT